MFMFIPSGPKPSLTFNIEIIVKFGKFMHQKNFFNTYIRHLQSLTGEKVVILGIFACTYKLPQRDNILFLKFKINSVGLQ